MKKIYNSAAQLVGGTPLLELKRIEKELSLKAKIFAKLEYFNPAGSVKDRVALSMIEEAEKCGKLKEGATIIEPTSGNTGIGIAALGAAKGYKVIIVMPDTMSEERRKLISAYGAKIALSDGSKGMKGSIATAEKLSEEIDDAVILGQFDNTSNPAAHYNSTGPEILNDTDGKIDFFVSGVGTGGTISGVGRFLKEKLSDVKIIAVEPKNSPILSEGKSGSHKIQGIGAGFIPKILDTEVYDEVIDVSDDDAYKYCKMIARTEGILVGISSGAALSGAIEISLRTENKGKNVVVIFPDSGDRYLSTGVFD